MDALHSPQVGHSPIARSELPDDTKALARWLIGKIVVRRLPEGIASGRIVETEAYVVGDAAGHGYIGMTKRNRTMFLEAGLAYIYLAYGVSFMLNVSSEAAGIGTGVLIRALEPLEGVPLMQKNRGLDGLRDWHAGREGFARPCGSISRWMEPISAAKVRSGSPATRMSPATSGSARGSASPKTPTVP